MLRIVIPTVTAEVQTTRGVVTGATAGRERTDTREDKSDEADMTWTGKLRHILLATEVSKASKIA